MKHPTFYGGRMVAENMSVTTQSAGQESVGETKKNESSIKIWASMAAAILFMIACVGIIPYHIYAQHRDFKKYFNVGMPSTEAERIERRELVIDKVMKLSAEAESVARKTQNKEEQVMKLPAETVRDTAVLADMQEILKNYKKDQDHAEEDVFHACTLAHKAGYEREVQILGCYRFGKGSAGPF
jgi:hypothetical protein